MTIDGRVRVRHFRCSEELFSNRQLRRIGVCWRGDQRVPHLRSRSFDPMHLLALARIPGVELINLQHGVDPPADLPLTTLPGLRPHTMRLEDVAGAMMDLDLVITCDTSIAHLAGALGVPVWVALKHAPCWRWMLDREDSPWYPTMRLFRQARPGEWKPVCERMAERLAAEFAIPPREQLFDKCNSRECLKRF